MSPRCLANSTSGGSGGTSSSVFRRSHERACEARVRQKIRPLFGSSSLSAVDEDEKTKKKERRAKRRDEDVVGGWTVEETKAEIERVEKQLREKRREEEEERKKKKKKKKIRRSRRRGRSDEKNTTWIDRKGPEPASRAMARRLLETLEERWSGGKEDAWSSSSSSSSESESDDVRVQLNSSTLVTFTSRNTTTTNNTQSKEDENKKCYNQKLKVLETIARETSRQIHAQCRDRGELIDAVLERYRDVIDAKDQEIEEARLQNRRLIAMRDFANTQSERDGEEKIALAKSLAATRREQKRVQVLNEKISSEFAHAKLRWQEISTERKNRRDLEREALIKAQKELKQLKETMYREIRAQTMVLEKKLAHALDNRDDSRESLRYAEERLRLALAKSPRGKPIDMDAQTSRLWMKHTFANGGGELALGMCCENTADASSQTDADSVMLGWNNRSNDESIETSTTCTKKKRGDTHANRNGFSSSCFSTSAHKSSSLGGFARHIQTSKIHGREKPKSWTLRTIAQIYADKIATEKDQEKQQQQQQQKQQTTSATIGGEGGSQDDLASFAYEWHVHRYGLRQLAETNCLDLIASCKVHSTSSLKIRQFAAFCGLFESWNSSRSSPTGPVSNNTDENNTVHFGGDQDTYDFYLKVLDALAPNGHVSSLFPENESANGKAIRCSEVQSNKTAGSTIKMMNFDDSGKVTFSHACAAVKALFSNVLVNERTSVQFNSNSRSNNNNNNNNNRLTEKEKMDALARAFLFHRGLETSSSSSSSSAGTGIKKKIAGTTVDADDVVSILMIEHEKRSKRNARALIVLFCAMNCEDFSDAMSTGSFLSSGLSREDFYAAFRIASDGTLTDSNIHAAWKQCVDACTRSSSVDALSDSRKKKKMTKKRNTRRPSSSHESKHVKATSRVGEHDDIISETTLLEKTIVDDKYISVRIPDHVFVSVAKKRCFLGAFEIQSENRSPRRGGVGFAARRKNTTTTTTTTSFAIIPEEEVEEDNEEDGEEDEDETATTPSTKTAESAYYDAFETECRLCKELFDLLDDLKSKFDPARPFAPFDTTATHIIRDSLLRCEKLRNKYIREQQHPAKRGDYTFSRKEKTFLRALVLKALSLELQKIQVKRRGGIKRVGELVRATVSFKLRGGEKSSSGGRIPSPPPPRRRSSSVVLSQYA